MGQTGKNNWCFYWKIKSANYKRKKAYMVVLQSTAKLASALSTCSKFNAQYVETIKKQKETIRHLKSIHTSKVFTEQTGENVDTSDLINKCTVCNKKSEINDSDMVKRFKSKIDIVEKERLSLNNELDKSKRTLEKTQQDLKREHAHSTQLCKQIESQHEDYANMEKQHKISRNEQIQVIEYLQNEVKKGAAKIAELKTHIASLHAEKQKIVSYMNQRLEMAQCQANTWRMLQSTCDQTIRNVSDIPLIIKTVKDDIYKLQKQMEIQQQRSLTNEFKTNSFIEKSKSSNYRNSVGVAPTSKSDKTDNYSKPSSVTSESNDNLEIDETKHDDLLKINNLSVNCDMQNNNNQQDEECRDKRSIDKLFSNVIRNIQLISDIVYNKP